MAAKTFEDWWDSRGGGSFGLGVASGAWNAATKAMEAQSASNNSDLVQLLRDCQGLLANDCRPYYQVRKLVIKNIDAVIAQLH